MSAAAAWAADLVRFLLPAGCVACGAWLPDRGRSGLTCATCRTRLPRAPWPRCSRCHHPSGTGRSAGDTCRACAEWPAALTRARYAHVLAHPAEALVHGLKYGGWRALAAEMGDAVAPLAPRGGGTRPADVVVPVPTTPKRLRHRGYNQAALLAARVAERLRVPCVDALARGRGGPTQVSLPPSLRWANVKGVFAPRADDARLRGAHVLLVDDVLTTGATAAAAATALTGMGAAEVTLAAYARALPDRDAA